MPILQNFNGPERSSIILIGQRDPSKFALTSPAVTMTALAAAMANEKALIPLFKKRRIVKNRGSALQKMKDDGKIF